jgi:NAD(P)-dependent dehydrogenase (short-subunit alcohol dehydrogenase family)
MLEARWGRMVTISSSSAQSGAARMAHYVASKGGVIALTKALALELAPHGITVNTITPGMIDTPMLRGAEARGDIGKLEKFAPRFIPVGRTGTPDEIAATCGFLCSDEASFITGQVIGVNGGMVL